MEKLVTVFKALADRNRLQILKKLEAKSLYVCEITEVLGIAQASTSHHLGILRDAGLLTSEKDGLWVKYCLSRSSDDLVATLLIGIRRWGNDDILSKEGRKKVAVIDRGKILDKAG